MTTQQMTITEAEYRLLAAYRTEQARSKRANRPAQLIIMLQPKAPPQVLRAVPTQNPSKKRGE